MEKYQHESKSPVIPTLKDKNWNKQIFWLIMAEIQAMSLDELQVYIDSHFHLAAKHYEANLLVAAVVASHPLKRSSAYTSISIEI